MAPRDPNIVYASKKIPIDMKRDKTLAWFLDLGLATSIVGFSGLSGVFGHALAQQGIGLCLGFGGLILLVGSMRMMKVPPSKIA